MPRCRDVLFLSIFLLHGDTHFKARAFLQQHRPLRSSAPPWHRHVHHRSSSSPDDAATPRTKEFRDSLAAVTASAEGDLVDVSRPIEILLDGGADVELTRAEGQQLLSGVPLLFKSMQSKNAAAAEASGANTGPTQEELLVHVQLLTSRLYDALAARKLLRGFRCIGPGDEPVPDKNIQSSDLKTLIGFEQSALTPGGNGDIWTYAGVAVCVLEIAGASMAGIDPLVTVLPATAICFGADRLLLRGAVFETCYRTLFPQYRAKVIRHEAAHFLVAYLLGCPIESCIISAWDALVDPRFTGQAGTLFFDPAFSQQMATGQIPRSSLDRYSIIVMAGIAGEALEYGKAEGGASDEAAIIDLFTSTNPPWQLDRVRDQARWGVVQAALLLEEHKAAYAALVATLENNGDLGECVMRLEEGLGESELPCEARKRRRANAEAAMAMTTVEPPKPLRTSPAATVSSARVDTKADLEARLEEVNRKLAAQDEPTKAADAEAPSPSPSSVRSDESPTSGNAPE